MKEIDNFMMTTVYKTIIKSNYRAFYGKAEGNRQFKMWKAVNCINTLRVAVDRAIEMNDEPLIEQEES